MWHEPSGREESEEFSFSFLQELCSDNPSQRRVTTPNLTSTLLYSAILYCHIALMSYLCETFISIHKCKIRKTLLLTIFFLISSTDSVGGTLLVVVYPFIRLTWCRFLFHVKMLDLISSVSSQTVEI